MKKLSAFVTLLLVLQLVLPFMATTQAEELNVPTNYLAIGDSLAAGMNEKGEIGKGYADFIAQLFSDEESEVKFNKGFSYPGYTTEDVLKDIQANVTKPIYDLNGPSQATVGIKQSIEQADFITLSAGANDVLKYVNRTETGEFNFDIAGVLVGIQNVAANYEKIFEAIHAINPDVDVSVMGLYNPFPHLQDPAKQAQLNMLVATMNNSIKVIVEKNEGVFSSVADLIASNSEVYLPNPNNIHLSQAGYEVVAEQMVADYFAAIEKETPLEDAFSDISTHWGRDFINVAYDYGIIKGFEDGTFKPNTDLTRVQAVSVLTRAFELTATKPAPFKDISQYPQDIQNEIAAAFEAGLLKENNGVFNPKGTITRAHFALMLMRLSNNVTGEEYVPAQIAPFTDIENFDQETKYAISYLYDYEIVEGTSPGKFSPNNKLTRAQIAKILVLTLSE